MKPHSLAFRLSLQQQVLASALIVVSAALLIGIASGTMARQERDYLSAATRQITTSLEHEWSEEGNLAAAAAAMIEETVPSDVWVEVFDARGHRVATTLRREGRPASSDLRTRRARLTRGAEVVVSVSTRSRHRAVSALLWALALTAVPLLAASIVTSRVLVRRALAPLSRITAQAEGAGNDAVTRSLTVPSDPQEIVTLSTAFDRLLAKVQGMLRSERNFSQDAAHELRTPLSILSGELELARSDAALTERNRYSLARAAEQVRTMSDLVDALLLLRRADFEAAQPSAEFEYVDLNDLARDVADDLLAREPMRVRDLEFIGPDHVEVLGQVTLLGVAVRNLLDNALKFTTAGQPVRVTVATGSEAVSVVVEDGGPGIPAADRGRVFDPFFRGGEARASRTGVGLGLPIILRVARAHGGEVEVSESSLGGARFELKLPRRAPEVRGVSRTASARRVTSAVLLAAVIGLAPCAARAQIAAAPSIAAPPILTRDDAWFGAAAVAGVLLVGVADVALRDDLRMAGGARADRLSDLVRPLGTPAVLGSGLVLGALSGTLLDRPGWTRANLRIAAGIGVSAVACGALKGMVGRERPAPSMGDVDEFRPFSGHDSFPSGHTTVAFAAAAGIDRETGARWVPWVVYPLAGLVGWSRVHDDRHWASDAVAGAALGIWSARKVEEFARARGESRQRLGAMMSGGPRSARLAMQVTF